MTEMGGRSDGTACDAFDVLPAAMFFLDCGGRVRYANRAAKSLTCRDAALDVGGRGVLRARRRETDQLLRAAVTEAISSATQRRVVLAIETPERPLAAAISGLAPGLLRCHGLSVRAIVIVADPASLARPQGCELHRLYGMTTREAELAEWLGKGLKLNEAARAMAIGVEAARTHLARVMQKTHTHSQAELLRVLLLGCPLVIDDAR